MGGEWAGRSAPRRAGRAPPTCGGAARAGGGASTHPARSRRINQRGAICCRGHRAGGGCRARFAHCSGGPARCLGGGSSGSAGLRQHRRPGPRSAAQPAAAKVLLRLAWPRAAAEPLPGSAWSRRASRPEAGAGRTAQRPSPLRHAAGAHHEARPGEDCPGVRRALLARHRLLLPGQLPGGGGWGLRAGASEADAPRRGADRRAAGGTQPRRRQAAPPRRPDQVDRGHGGGLRGYQLPPHADRPAGDVLREPARQVLREGAIQGKGHRLPAGLTCLAAAGGTWRKVSTGACPCRVFAARGCQWLGQPRRAVAASPLRRALSGGQPLPAPGAEVLQNTRQRGCPLFSRPAGAGSAPGRGAPSWVFAGLLGRRAPVRPLPVPPCATGDHFAAAPGAAGGASLPGGGSGARQHRAAACYCPSCGERGLPAPGVPRQKSLTLAVTFLWGMVSGGGKSPLPLTVRILGLDPII